MVGFAKRKSSMEHFKQSATSERFCLLNIAPTNDELNPTIVDGVKVAVVNEVYPNARVDDELH